MRIISGELGGRRIKTMQGNGIRPAMERARESIFSILESRDFTWEGKRILDLFAGSGSLAFECLSRGATGAVLVENSARHCALLEQNTVALELQGRVRVSQLDASRFLRSRPGVPFNLAFIDPPYGRKLAQPCLDLLIRGNWLAPESYVIMEIEKDAIISTPESMELETSRLFGQTRIHIWKKI